MDEGVIGVKNHHVRYEIRKGRHAPCELWSIVTRSDTWYGKDHEFKNFVCEGTHTHCNKIKERLEA
jgi:hypothetical protein